MRDPGLGCFLLKILLSEGLSGLAFPFTHLPGVLPMLPWLQSAFLPISSHFITKKNKTKHSDHVLTCQGGAPGVRAPWTALALLPCVLLGFQSRGCSWTPPLPENLQPETLTSTGKGSPGSIPDLQTRLAARWPHARDNHFLPGCLPSCARGPSQGGGPTPEPEAVQEGRCYPR